MRQPPSPVADKDEMHAKTRIPTERVTAEVVVVGGGLAGVCAAIAAARLGRSVALVTNRPVLGGNASSEVRVWVVGGTSHGRQRYARETGIMGELFVENQFTNPEGNPYYWDLVVLGAVRAEPNISLFLNTEIHDVEASGPVDERRIEAVTGWMTGSERRLRFQAAMFLDCSGDGLVGHLAGARYRIGREARAEYDEPWAPEAADDLTLGSTMLFYSKDAGHPVPFVPPTFSRDISTTSIPEHRVISVEKDGCWNWWIEWGGEVDAVRDNERIRDELWAVIYGVWDYIKNSGEFPEAEPLTLEWVGSVPGKREYRRFVGDYTLTQKDILGQTEFLDRIGHGGWSIDLHPPGGVYAAERGSKSWHPDGNYHIPLRSLYSVNVENLLFAGRNISASHVAFGSTRVMATCAVIGEAAGSAAALAIAKNATPRDVAHEHIDELQQVMLRQDASLLGVANTDRSDLARTARVTSSSSLGRVASTADGVPFVLEVPAGLVVPVDPEIAGIGLFLEVSRPTSVTVDIHETDLPQNYVPGRLVATVDVPLEAGRPRWVHLDVSWRPRAPCNAFVVVRENPNVALATTTEQSPGVLSFARRDIPYRVDGDQPLIEWMKLSDRRAFAVQLGSATRAFAPERAVGGYSRPYGGPQMWVSEPMRPGTPEWLQLAWPAAVTVGRIELVLDDDVNEDLVNLHHHRTPFRIMPTLIRDYQLEAYVDGEWRVLERVRQNRRRRHLHVLEQPVTTDRIRLVVGSTNGAANAHVVSLRAYGPEAAS
ncbi:FAD-dependent oxidoreductase [Occultella kanbiaonis]|uniref:FAD-dependent oxidoreductase n=1 Tax=Occultella kanbiaonis TaxID=2675754 RepID=UPI001E48361C|nr:FAD-dependent oxidoreductase [Occultella kanbiaonis]